MSTHGGGSSGVSERTRRYGTGHGKGSGIPGRPTSAGTRHSPALTYALNAREYEIVQYTTEHAHVYAADGTHVTSARAVGRQPTVHFSDAQLARLPGTTLTHNHPGGNSFSPDDVRFAAENRLAEIRAVTRSYRYSLTPPAGGWQPNAWRDTLGPAYRRTDSAVAREFNDAIRAGRLTPKVASARHWHEVWTRVAAETGVGYTRSTWKPGRETNPADLVPAPRQQPT